MRPSEIGASAIHDAGSQGGSKVKDGQPAAIRQPNGAQAIPTNGANRQPMYQRQAVEAKHQKPLNRMELKAIGSAFIFWHFPWVRHVVTSA